MKVKTSELTGKALDYAVEQLEFARREAAGEYIKPWWREHKAIDPTPYSSDWQWGGPIIEREGFQFHQWGEDGPWEANYPAWKKIDAPRTFGENHLVSAMRCYVSARSGEEVDIPEELPA